MASHVSKVRSLYKRILLLHHFMPIDLRALGDQYVKDEFRKHKTASNEEAKRFMTEWEAIPDKLKKGLPIYVISIGNDSAYIQKVYKDTLQTQILESVNRKKLVFGADLSEEKLKGFQDEQIGQLYELMLESTKPNRQFDIQEEDMPK